jgi:2-methylcitrate dehydratase PrpD
MADKLVDIACRDTVIDPEARRLAALQIRDIYGVALAGSRTTTHQRALAALTTSQESGPSAVWGTTLTVAPVSAAAINSTAAACLDFDDIAPTAAAHLSSVLVPALASVVHRCDPADAEAGYLTALRAAMALTDVFSTQIFRAGFQNTCLIGTVTAAIGVARALRLHPSQILQAIALSAPHMMGLRAHTGTDFKAGQTGMAAATAVRCALWAEQGFTANPAALDEVARLVGADPAPLTQDNPQPLPMATKTYPCVGSTHAPIEAAILLAGRAGGRHLDKLVVHADRKAFAGAGFDQPHNGNQARFSMKYAVATAWLTQGVGIADFTDEMVLIGQRQQFLGRVELVHDDDFLQVTGQAVTPCQVVAVYADGSTDQESIPLALGFPGRRLDEAGYRRKFLACVSNIWPPDQAAATFDAIGERGLFATLAD